MPPSFNPALGLIFVTARESCATFVPQEPVIEPGRNSSGGIIWIDRDQGYGALRAIDVMTGERRWEFRYSSPTMAGVMTTASGLVFAGDNDRSRRLAEEHGKLMSAATDAHTPWEIGLAYTEMPPFEGPGDFLTALGKGKVVGKRSFGGFHLRSTWAKIRWRLHLGRRVAQ